MQLAAAHLGAPVRGVPLQLTLLPPAFGLGLQRATADEAERFWVYLGAAPRVAPHGSYAEAQRALQSVQVELRNEDDPSARVAVTVVPPELRALRGRARALTSSAWSTAGRIWRKTCTLRMTLGGMLWVRCSPAHPACMHVSCVSSSSDGIVASGQNR